MSRSSTSTHSYLPAVPALGIVLDRMEERGLVRRERDSRDRRIWRIWLTDAGKELETVLPPIAVEIREQAMAGIPVAEREMFSNLIDQAIANLS